MKNNKLKILVEVMRRIDSESMNSNKSQQQQSTEVSFQCNENLVTGKSIQMAGLKKIFPDIKLSEVAQDFQEPMPLPPQILGKKSSKILISRSSKYCMKIAEEQDIDKIVQMFPHLSLRFQDSSQNCLVNIYCMFTVDYSISGVKIKNRYIVMPNIRANFDHSLKAFDIKGHLEARTIDEEDSKDFKFGKDENFIRSDQLNIIRHKLHRQQIAGMIAKISQNAQFLAKNNIIDYSLLISLEKQTAGQKAQGQYPCQQIRIDKNTVLKWAIIDYFQIYNQKKKMQNRFKSIFCKSISSVQPEIYSKRLVAFLEKYLLG